jgi:hypothetical protein
MKELDKFFQKFDEPLLSCLIALKEIILKQDKNITSEWKYGMPFFYYKGKMFCYLWVHKKYKQPYIGMIEGKYFTQDFMLQEKRARIKIMLMDVNKDLPITRIKMILKQGIDLYKSVIEK